MQRRHGIWVLTVLGSLPLAWLVATTPVDSARGQLVALGAVVTFVVVLRQVWRLHRAGRLLAHRCLTCEHPMVQIGPGDIRPPSGHAAGELPRWRCRSCGRLAP